MHPYRIPDVAEHEDANAWLKAWFELNHEERPTRLARWLANKIGCTHAQVFNLVEGARLQPEQVVAIGRALGLSLEAQELLRERVLGQREELPKEVEPAAEEEEDLSGWGQHTVSHSDAVPDLGQLLAASEMARAEELALLPLLSLLERHGLPMEAAEILPLLVAPPDPARVLRACQAADAGASLADTLGWRAVRMLPPGPSGGPRALGWIGLLHRARETYLATSPAERAFGLQTWTADAIAMKESQAAIDALETELLELVTETAGAPATQILQVQVEQVRLTEPMTRGADSAEPPLPPPLTSKILGSRVIEDRHAHPEELTRPCLFDALEFHPFAQRWIAWRRGLGKPCSAAWLANQMRVGETLANDLSTGRTRPKPRHVPRLVQAYGLTKKEAIFLEGIARHELATDLEDKARQRMALLRYAVAQGVRHPVGERWRVAAHWGPRAIWGLSTLDGFWANPIWISLALRGRLPVAQAKDMLQTLIYTRLLVPEGEGVLRVAEPTLQLTPPDQEVADFALHDSVLSLLRQEVAVAAPDQRFLALSLMLPAEAIPRAFAIGETFRDRMKAIITAAQRRAEAGESLHCALMLTDDAQGHRRGPA